MDGRINLGAVLPHPVSMRLTCDSFLIRYTVRVQWYNGAFISSCDVRCMRPDLCSQETLTIINLLPLTQKSYFGHLLFISHDHRDFVVVGIYQIPNISVCSMTGVRKVVNHVQCTTHVYKDPGPCKSGVQARLWETLCRSSVVSCEVRKIMTYRDERVYC